MKQTYFFLLILLSFSLSEVSAQKSGDSPGTKTHLFIDVHNLGSGNVTFADVAAAHAKDLATQDKYGAKFIKYWVDEKAGNVYCLSSATDTNNILQTHRHAHGLMPHAIYQVSDGNAAAAKEAGTYFLDIHQLGAGKVRTADVEKAHQKDLRVQSKYGVNFLNYWVDEKSGLVFCLSQASNADDVTKTHKDAHGLLPTTIVAVREGN